MSEPVFTLQHTDGAARAGLLRTAHGVIPTPIFMPVGTVGSVKAIAPDDLAAIGGLSVGEGKAEMYDLLYHTAPLLPSHKPRYLMGVGTPLDIAHGIHAGVDMFDCVLPTRNARNGTLYTSLGKVNIKRKEYAEDDGPLDPACGCYTCRTFSRAYLRHLYVSKELLSFRLNSLHNLTYFLRLAREARQAVLENRFGAFLAGMEALYPEEAAQAAGV